MTAPLLQESTSPSLMHIFRDYAMILLAGFLYAIALKYFVLPSNIILTGTEGIASVLSYYFDSYWLFIILYLVFQSVLLTFGFMRVSQVFATRSMLVVLTVVVLLTALPDLKFADPDPNNERIILVLFGGILSGAAKALAFKYRGSTGDEDILGAYFAAKYLKPVGSIGIIAAIVSTTFGLVMKILKYGGEFEPVVNTLMYTSVYIFVSAETLNNTYRKFKITMLAVITKRRKQIGEAITNTSAHRTYTTHQGVGGHSRNSFFVIRTIITHEELPAMIHAIQEADPQCFYYHHDLEGVSSRYYISPIG